MIHELRFHRNNLANLLHAHAAHVVHFHIVMYHTLLSARARSCQQSNAHFEGICGFGSLPQECCPSMLFQSTVCCMLQICFEIVS